ncbi:MAG TPA: AAA family ATPase [Solirubrobacteraceae bacterium]|nr:AAA family ATPase [Solirubrobacteraceae bacterium]
MLVEREAELAAIDRALGGAAVGQGRLVLVEGPAGIGKTALLDAARERANAAGVVALVARGAELEGDFPYGVVRQLLEPTVRQADAPRRERLLEGAATLARPAVLTPEAGPADAVDRGFAIAHGLYWLVANLAAEEPVALLMDDVHWADAPSLRFLVYLARRLSGLGASMVVSVRTGEEGADQGVLRELERCPGADVVSPLALTDAGTVRVLTVDFGRAPDPEFARSCRHVTGGNPFFVHELAAALIADGIEPTAGASEQVSAAAPRAIARVTLGRLSRLSDDAVAMARAIAVLGRDARLPRAAAVAGLREGRALSALDALVAAHLVLAGDRLDFRHPIVRAAIYDELAPGARSSAHRRAAALLASEGAEVDAVAAHLMRSEPVGDPDTIATLREAAAHALALGAPDSAANYLERALAEGPERELRGALLLDLGLAEKLTRRPAAIERFEEVRRLAEDPVTRARAMIEQGEILSYVGDWQQALALFDGALLELADRDDAVALRAEAFRAVLTAYDPRLVDAFVEHLPRLRALVASASASARPLAMLLAAWGAARDERSDRVIELVELAWADGQYLVVGDSIELLPQGISALVLCEQLDRADEIVAAVRAAAQRSGSVMQQLVASAHEAWIETRRGDLAAAAAEMRGALEPALELGLQFPVLITISYCVDVMLERPDVSDLAALAETIDLGAMADVLAGAMLIDARGRLRFAAGQRTAAIADMRHAGAINDALGFTNTIGFASWRSALALMLGPAERDEALALAGAELSDARRSGHPRRIGIALRALGTLEPDRDTGRSHLEEAVHVLEDSPARLEHARALVELGAARRRAGERAAAREPLRDGLDLAGRCGAVRLAERARAELAAAGSRPRRDYTTGRDALTPSELRVASMAAEGHTNKDIAQALFVTAATVETHLHHTYTKLDITSRKQLAVALARASD